MRGYSTVQYSSTRYIRVLYTTATLPWHASAKSSPLKDPLFSPLLTMTAYLINGWDDEIPMKDIQGYLDRGELYDDCWAKALPEYWPGGMVTIAKCRLGSEAPDWAT